MIYLFLDTNNMPRIPDHIGHAYSQLIDLVKAKQVAVLISEVVRREWETQVIGRFLDVVSPVKASLKNVGRQRWNDKVVGSNEFSRFMLEADGMTIKAGKAAIEECKES